MRRRALAVFHSALIQLSEDVLFSLRLQRISFHQTLGPGSLIRVSRRSKRDLRSTRTVDTDHGILFFITQVRYPKLEMKISSMIAFFFEDYDHTLQEKSSNINMYGRAFLCSDLIPGRVAIGNRFVCIDNSYSFFYLQI